MRHWSPRPPQNAALHGKVRMIGQKMLFVGSASLAHQGLEHSYETVASTFGQEPSQEFQLMFEELWPVAAPVRASSTPITTSTTTLWLDMALVSAPVLGSSGCEGEESVDLLQRPCVLRSPVPIRKPACMGTAAERC